MIANPQQARMVIEALLVGRIIELEQALVQTRAENVQLRESVAAQAGPDGTTIPLEATVEGEPGG